MLTVLPLRAAENAEGTTVVFDGYDHPTTKNDPPEAIGRQSRCSSLLSGLYEGHNEKRCFLANTQNKKRYITTAPL